MTRSIQQLPNNTNSSSIVEVATATGFNAGDLIYYQNGDYKPQASLTGPTLANFPANLPGTILSADTGGFGTPVFNATAVQTTNGSGSSKAQCNAVLTNGNIVHVFSGKDTNLPSFRILNPSGTVVVATTTISNVVGVTGGLITVCALTGGGFAVLFLVTNQPYYAVYTNSGSVTTVATLDTLPSGTMNSASPLGISALANGGFAAFAGNTAPTLYLKIYTSTGATTSTWTSVATTTSNSYPVAICSRSDSSIFIGYVASGNYYYALYNATGGTIVAGTNTSQAYQGQLDCVCLNDGTTITYAFGASNGVFAYQLPTGNTLSSLKTIVSASSTNFPGSGTVTLVFSCVRLLTLSAGGFAFLLGDSIGNLYLGASNSSITTLLPYTNTVGLVPYLIKGISNPNLISANAYRPSVYELSGTIYFWYVNANTNYSSSNMTQIVLSESTYSATPSAVLSNYIPPINVPVSIGSASTSTSYPTAIKYYAGSTLSNLSTNSVAIYASPVSLSSNVFCMHSCTLTNGNSIIAYQNSSTSILYAAVIAPNGIILTTINVGLMNQVTNLTAGLRVAPMANGKFAIAWCNNSGYITVNYYSASYSLITSFTNTSIASASTAGQGFDMAGSTVTDYIALLGNNASTCSVYVYNNAGILLQTIGVNNNQWYYRIVADSTNGFFLSSSSAQTSGSIAYFKLTPVSSVAWNLLSLGNGGGYGCDTTMKLSITNTGMVEYAYATSATAVVNSSADIYAVSSINEKTGASYTTLTSIQGDVGSAACGVNGNGNTLMVVTNGSLAGSGNLLMTSGNNIISTATSTYTSGAGTNYITQGVTLNSYPSIWVTPSTGYNAIVSWRNQTGQGQFMIVTVCPDYIITSVTSGVSLSNNVPLIPTTSTTSPSIANTVLAGVAATSASAGSTGQVVINGLAQLNSNYSASNIGAFDHTGQAIDGVRGTYNGRTVNLQGNS